MARGAIRIQKHNCKVRTSGRGLMALYSMVSKSRCKGQGGGHDETVFQCMDTLSFGASEGFSANSPPHLTSSETVNISQDF